MTYTSLASTTDHFQLALYCFAVGVLSQSLIFKPTESFKTTLQAMMAMLIVGFIVTGLVALKNKGVNFDPEILIMTTLIFYMVIYSVCFFNKILPNITEQYLMLYNCVFLYYLWIQGWRIDYYLIPSILIVLNALIPSKISDHIKFAFYLWYLWMSVTFAIVLSSSISGEATFSQLIKVTQVDWEWIATFISFGMIYLCVFVNSVHVLIPFCLLYAKFKTGTKDKESAEHNKMLSGSLKLYLSTIYSKYHDEEMDIYQNAVVFMAVIFVLFINQYLLHLNDIVIANLILLMGNYKLEPPVRAVGSKK